MPFQSRAFSNGTASFDIFGAIIPASGYTNILVPSIGPAVLLSLFGYNSGPTQWIQIFDTKTTPSNGDKPLHTFVALTADNFSAIIPLTGLPCGKGVFILNSTTGPTLTQGAADCWFTCTLQG